MLIDRGMRVGDICWKCKKNPATTEVNGKPVCDKCAKENEKVFIRVLLPQKQKDYLEKLVENKIFVSQSEAVRAAIHMLEKEYPIKEEVEEEDQSSQSHNIS